MSIIENIERIKSAKADLREAINAKGGELSEDAKIEEFAEAVENISTGQDLGHYGVDFADKIAEGHPAFASPLKSNVDYYNSVVESIISGECTEEDYLTGEKMVEFKTKIAWIPPSFTKQTSYSYYTNLQYVKISANDMMDSCVVGYMDIEQNVDSTLSKITTNSIIDTINTKAYRTYLYGFINTCVVRKFSFNGGFVVPSFVAVFHSRLIEMNNFFIRNSEQVGIIVSSKILTTFTFSGLSSSIALDKSPVLSTDSVKYMLANCVARADGASYTLTLHEDVKTRFMAKCEEDASYAEALANANAKGLTIA